MTAEAEPAQRENAQATTIWVRNCTPDHLRLRVGKTLLVFAPLQRRQLSVDDAHDLEPLVQEGVLALSTPISSRFDKFARLIEALPAILAVGFVAALFLNSWLDAGSLIVIGFVALVLVVVAILMASFGSSTVARLVGQMVMLSLVVVISIGVPALVVWRYGLDDLEAGNPLTELARMLLVVFIALACMVPGLLFFLFDRQRLSTLRARFEQQIFRLDPRVDTLADVEARYGNQLDEMYGQTSGSVTARLARQGRWPIPLATVVLAFGWILALLPVKSDPPPASLADVALSFAPQANTVAFGFLGAYFFAINLILRRYARDDLRPKAYSTIAVRVIVAVLLGWLVKVIAPDWWPQAVLLVAAFLIGIVPETFLTLLQELYRTRWVKRATNDIDEPIPLKDLEGIDLYDRARLLDEGIANVEALANHDLIDLLLETRIPAARLIDWMDQAVLHLHTRSSPDLRNALRRAGIRTASDLVTVYTTHPNALIDTLGRSLKWEKERLLENTLKVLVASLYDDEWMDYIRYWRTGSTVHERTIILRDGNIDDVRRPRSDDRPVGRPPRDRLHGHTAVRVARSSRSNRTGRLRRVPPHRTPASARQTAPDADEVSPSHVPEGAGSEAAVPQTDPLAGAAVRPIRERERAQSSFEPGPPG
jgi:hypothetical protein